MLMSTGRRGQPGYMETMQEMDVPDLRETPGGWLAVATDSPRVAVVGDTRDDALAKFQAERAIWRRLIVQTAQDAPSDAG
jgi:hypothetical protein